MLTLFVVPSHEKNADVDRTIDSFHGMQTEYKVVPVSDWREINKYKKDAWYGVFWDNEYVDEGLRNALPVFLGFPKYEMLILYKRVVLDITWRIRIFRDYVYLVGDFAPVSLWLTKEAVLDGWVREHEHPN